MDIGTITRMRNIAGDQAEAATKELLRLAQEHPDYPITVIVGEDCNRGDYSWEYANHISVKVEEILSCNSRWWDKECVCADRGELEEEIAERVNDRFYDENGRTPTEEELDALTKEILAAHEPHWKKVIAVYVSND